MQVEYLHGYYNDVLHIVEYDRQARIEQQKRRGDKFTYDELVRKLGFQRLEVPYFRRILTMETSPRDLVIKVMWPGGQSDIFNWQLKQTEFVTRNLKVCINHGRRFKMTHFPFGIDKCKFVVTQNKGEAEPTEGA